MRKKTLFICFCILMGFSLSAQSVRAVMESSTAYIGQGITYTIRISGREKVDRPLLEGFRGIRVAEAGESTSVRTTLLNGSRSQEVVTEYSWILTPLETGKIPIPAVPIAVDGQDLSTREGILTVREPGPLEGFHLFLSLEETTLFPGLPARLSLRWLISSPVSQPDFSLPFLDDPDVTLRTLPAPSGRSNDVYQFTIGGQRVYATQSAEIYEGEQYTSLSLAWDIIPRAEGTLHLDPVILSFKRGIGRDNWGNTQYENAVIPSNPLSFEVEAVPEELARDPGGLFIAKEALQGSLQISPRQAYPGDPLTVEIELKNLVQPGMTEYRGLHRYDQLKDRFRVDQDSLLFFEEEGTLKIRQTLRAVEGGDAPFPALQFAYYNQAKGRTEVFATAPVELEIIPVAFPGLAGSAQTLPGAVQEQQSDLIGLFANESLAAIRPRRYRLIPLWIYLLAPPGLFLLVYTLTLLFSGDPRRIFRFFFSQDDPVLLLEERIRSLEQKKNRETWRHFNQFLRSWIAEQLNLAPEAAPDVLSAALQARIGQDQAAEILDHLEQLDRLCWTDVPEEPAALDPRTFSPLLRRIIP